MTALSSRVERLDPRDRRLDQLRGRRLAGADELGLGGGVQRARSSAIGVTAHRSFSSPTVKRVGQVADPAHREQHAGHERAAVDRVVADRERLALAAEDHLLVGDQARAAAPSGSARGRSPGLARSARAVRFAVPEGASSLRSWCSSTISHSGMCGGDRAAKPPSSAPRRSRSWGRRRSSPRLAGPSTVRAQLLEVEAGGADDGVDARRRRRRETLSSAVSGVVKSTTTSASPSTSAELDAERRVGPAGELHVVGALDRLADRRAHAPGGAGDDDPDHAGSTRPRGSPAPAAAEAVLVAARCRRPRAARGRRARRRARRPRRR